MVHRDVEEALDLVGVQVAGHHTVCSRRAQKVGDELCADGHSRTVLTVLARPAKVRHHGDNLVGRSPLGSIDGEQKLHQVVCRRDGRLKNEYGSAPDAFFKLRLKLTVAERSGHELAQMKRIVVVRSECVEMADHLVCEVLRCPAREEFHSVGMIHILNDL